jgi:hypothetical protein
MHPLCFYFIISKLYEPGVCSAFYRQSYLFSSLSVYIQATQLCFTDAKIAISYAKIKHNQNIFYFYMFDITKITSTYCAGRSSDT